jgi:hypothetical protein
MARGAEVDGGAEFTIRASPVLTGNGEAEGLVSSLNSLSHQVLLLLSCPPRGAGGCPVE